MAKKIVFTADQISELKQLMEQGIRQSDIAKHFKVTDDTIRKICKENDLIVKMPHKCKCIICGDIFYSSVRNAKTCNKEHHSKCVVCGKDFIVSRTDIKDTCSRECTSIKNYGVIHPRKSEEVKNKSKQTLIDRYGVDNPGKLSDHKEKTEKTCLEKYGATSYAGSEEGRKATRQTNLEKYGYEEPFSDPKRRAEIDQIIVEKYGTRWASQTDSVKARMKSTMLDKYGVENAMQDVTIMQKQHQSVFDHYGVSSLMQVPEIKDKLSQQFQDKYGYPWPVSDPSNRSTRSHSKLNERFEAKLSECNIQFESEFRLNNYSFDDKCGDILIEIDPTFTHNSAIGVFGCDPLKPDYHLNKSKAAEMQGYRCIHVFEWDSWDSIIELLKPKSVIYARKCEIHSITKQIAQEFEKANHIQGSCYSQSVLLGLFYNNELVQVMTFGKPRYSSKYDFELLRLCTLKGKTIVGGASKLFKHFTKLYPNSSVVSYCDAAKFSGIVYQKMGMKLLHSTQPAKVWSKGKNKITDNLLRQRGFDQLFNTDYGKGTSNEDLMLQHGWLPVFDCGQNVFVYNP